VVATLTFVAFPRRDAGGPGRLSHAGL